MASRSVNKVILVGHLGRDAETKFTPAGMAVTKFSVATNRRWKDQQSGEWKEETDWANIVLWRQENLANYLTKGKQVYVEGRLQTRSYDDKDGKKQYMTEVVAEDVILLGGRGGEGADDSGARSRCRCRAARHVRPRWLSRWITGSPTTTYRFRARRSFSGRRFAGPSPPTYSWERIAFWGRRWMSRRVQIDCDSDFFPPWPGTCWRVS